MIAQNRSTLTALAAGIIVLHSAGCDRRVTVDPAPVPTAVAKLRTQLEAGASGVVDGDDGAALVEPTGFATLRGRFTIQGTPPNNPKLKPNRDQQTCAPGGRPVFREELIVTPRESGGGIANVLLFADRVPAEWVHETAQPGNTDEVIFDQKQCIFLNRMTAIQYTQPLRILNSDPVGHNTKVGTTGFDQTIPSGGSAVFQAQGSENRPQEVSCAIHPWMNAWLITRENGYFAVSDQDGMFEIPYLPAGVELTFRVWQEKSKNVQSVTVGGQSESWSKGKFTRTMVPDETVEMDVVIDAAIFE